MSINPYEPPKDMKPDTEDIANQSQGSTLETVGLALSVVWLIAVIAGVVYFVAVPIK